MIDLSVRRLGCENPDCPKPTFVEQVDGPTKPYQRRTPAPRRVVEAVALAGSASDLLLNGGRYTTIIIDAETGERVEVLPDRRAATITS
ncbi:hypothetical protein [Streptomyces sp. NBC_00454]|uniref:hypothetical protein n=1 Tax=Streptomyces sp. NBC_00454 TaxID=2975747 RepID=UPI0030DEF0A4